MRIRLERKTGGFVFLVLFLYFVWWGWSFTGPTGELNPASRSRILFPITGNTAIHTTGYVWAREGDTIVLDYELQLASGYFNLTVGRSRWPFRRRLLHEESRAMRSSGAGQLVYAVKQSGRHVIWAGTYSVWSGSARVRWRVVPGT